MVALRDGSLGSGLGQLRRRLGTVDHYDYIRLWSNRNADESSREHADKYSDCNCDGDTDEDAN